MTEPKLAGLSDDALVLRLQRVCLEGNRLVAQLVAILVEIEDRRLHLNAACTSLFDFCTRRLGMSEGSAFRRINAARLARRFPSLVARIASGDVNLSTLVLLRDHLDEENVEELVDAMRGKTKREVAELLAMRAPRPDVPATLRKLPAQNKPASVSPVAERPFEALAEARYRLQLTASRELRDKLERARDLMMHSNPSGDLAVVVERAVDALLERLEKQRLGKTSRPTLAKADPTAGNSGAVRRAVRRKVFERDGEQCTFVDSEGRRCAGRAFLELDHVISSALGGSDDAPNLRVRCAAHNRLHAEEVFGEAYVRRRIDVRQRKSAKHAKAKRLHPTNS